MTKFWHSLLYKLETKIDPFKQFLKRKRGNYDPVMILPYMGFGSDKSFYIKGRVLENKGITGASTQDSIFKNLGNMYKRFESDEVGGVELKLSFNNKEYKIFTDEEGYFELTFDPGSLTQKLWHEVELEILNCPIPFTQGIKWVGKILNPNPGSSFGIVSDIDDTIVRTKATSLFKMAAITFINNARTRTPFKGVSEFYNALKIGKNKNLENPFYYVSSSPWNLYDLLVEFLIINNIPLGPLMLKDYGVDKSSVMSKGHLAHKYFQIEKILSFYPDLNFILIGDSGQDDPEIYRKVIVDFPGKILAVYIRDVGIPELAEKVINIPGNKTVPMVLVKDSYAAAEHAAKHGFISPDLLPEILHAVNK